MLIGNVMQETLRVISQALTDRYMYYIFRMPKRVLSQSAVTAAETAKQGPLTMGPSTSDVYLPGAIMNLSTTSFFLNSLLSLSLSGIQ